MDVLGTGSEGTEPSVIFSIQRHGVYSNDVTILQRYDLWSLYDIFDELLVDICSIVAKARSDCLVKMACEA